MVIYKTNLIFQGFFFFFTKIKRQTATLCIQETTKSLCDVFQKFLEMKRYVLKVNETLTGKSFLVVWDNENSASRKMKLNLQCKLPFPQWPGRLLLSPAELKGRNQTARACKSQRWFIARADCVTWSLLSKASTGHCSLWWDVNAARVHHGNLNLGFTQQSSILTRSPNDLVPAPIFNPQEIFLKIREGRKRGRETLMCGCLSRTSSWGLGLQPRCVPWLGIEPATLWVCRPALNTLSHSSQGRRFQVYELHMMKFRGKCLLLL